MCAENYIHWIDQLDRLVYILLICLVVLLITTAKMGKCREKTADKFVPLPLDFLFCQLIFRASVVNRHIKINHDDDDVQRRLVMRNIRFGEGNLSLAGQTNPCRNWVNCWVIGGK